MKEELLRRWRDLLAQHFRACNATPYYMCLKHLQRINKLY